MDHAKEREAAYRLLPALLPAHAGKWGVFHGDGLAAICDTFDQAAEFGYGRYDQREFLMVEIVEDAADGQEEG